MSIPILAKSPERFDQYSIGSLIVRSGGDAKYAVNSSSTTSKFSIQCSSKLGWLFGVMASGPVGAESVMAAAC